MGGVYIPNMEMPKSCCECFAFKSNASGQLFCKAKRISFGKEDAEWLPLKTPNWCPLVPVPPHGRLIDADAFLQTIRPITDEDSQAACTFETVKRLIVEHINGVPTIIEAEWREP